MRLWSRRRHGRPHQTAPWRHDPLLAAQQLAADDGIAMPLPQQAAPGASAMMFTYRRQLAKNVLSPCHECVAPLPVSLRQHRASIQVTQFPEFIQISRHFWMTNEKLFDRFSGFGQNPCQEKRAPYQDGALRNRYRVNVDNRATEHFGTGCNAEQQEKSTQRHNDSACDRRGVRKHADLQITVDAVRVSSRGSCGSIRSLTQALWGVT